MPEQFYTQKESVALGNYLLSDKRRESFEQNTTKNGVPASERLNSVTDADLDKEKWQG